MCECCLQFNFDDLLFQVVSRNPSWNANFNDFVSNKSAALAKAEAFVIKDVCEPISLFVSELGES